MRGFIMFLVGGILLGVGLLVYYKLGVQFSTGHQKYSPAVQAMVQYGVGGFLSGLGVLFIWSGFSMNAKYKQQKKLYDHILATGIPTEGKVLFVDKNYNILVNRKPIYSIVEYTYKDRSGKDHTKRVDALNSDYVIRKQIQVGSTIAIKYASEDPEKSIIVI